MANIKTIITSFVVVLAISTSIASATPYDTEIIDTASSYLNVRELTNHNDNPIIDKWMAELGLDNRAEFVRTKARFDAGRSKTYGGYSWCMGCVQGVFKQVYGAHARKSSLPRSARCSEVWKLAKKDKYRYKTFTAKQVETGAVKLIAADVAIFSSKKVSEDFAGHTEFVLCPTPKSGFDSIGGNVGESNEASQQREQTGTSSKSEHNGGVRKKHRTVKKTSPAFQTEGFIRTNDK